MLAFCSLAALCSKDSDFRVKVLNHSKTSLPCSIRLNEKLELKTISMDPGASMETRISLTTIRSSLKDLGQSTGILTLNCKGPENAFNLELFGYIEPSDNYLSGKVIVAEIHDMNQTKVSIQK